MIPILLLTHGTFADGIVDSARMLVGESEKLECLSLCPDDDFDIFQAKVQSKVEAIDEGDGVLALIDLLGGSPFNAAAVTMNRCCARLECLTGLNLSMLLTALDQRAYCSVEQLAGECAAAAASNIVSVREKLTEIEEEQ